MRRAERTSESLPWADQEEDQKEEEEDSGGEEVNECRPTV